MERDAGKAISEQRDLLVRLRVTVVDEGRCDLGERGGQPAHTADRTPVHALEGERLVADEEVQAQIKVWLDGAERRVRNLHPDDVGSGVSHAADDRGRDRVTAPARELIDVERERVCGVGCADEVAEQLVAVEREVRGGDDGDGIGAGLQGVGGQCDRVRGGLGTRMHRHLEAGRTRADEGFGHRAALGDVQEHALAGGAAHERAVDTAVGKERGETGDGVRIDPLPSCGQWGNRRSDGSPQTIRHGAAVYGAGDRRRRVRPTRPLRSRVHGVDQSESERSFDVEGRRVRFRAGDSLAIAMLREGLHPGSGGVLCLAGDCPNCLCSVDGVGFTRSCQAPATEGVDVRRHAAGDHDVAVPADRATAGEARFGHADLLNVDEARAKQVIGIYPGPQIVFAEAEGTLTIVASEIRIDAGSAEEYPVCPGNHLAGIFTGDAARLAAEAGVDLGRVVVVGAAAEPTDPRETIEGGILVRIEGDARVRGVVVRDRAGEEHAVDCDTVVYRGRRFPRDGLIRMIDDPAVQSADTVSTSELPDPPAHGLVCPCSNVTVGDLRSAWSRGFDEIELLKRATLAGTGTCQGSVCLPHIRAFAAAARDGADGGAFTARPFKLQITMAQAAAGAWFDPVKRTALDAEHRALGARMERSGGWWRPWTYGDTDREYLAVREAVGICDVSTLGTFWVGGRDAEAFLERVYPIRVGDLGPGHMRYSLLLDERGSVFDDGLVCRDGLDRFLLTVTTAGATGVEMWLRDWADAWGMDVRIMDRTDASAAINVTGPLAPALLTSLGVAQGSLPGPMRFADLVVAGVPSRVMRSAFTGEVSFELTHDPDASVRLWRALLEVGAAIGIAPHGLEALLRLRLDKGHVIVGLDTEMDSTPRRLGLEALIDRSKPAFVGKEMLERSERSPLDRRLVGLEMDGPAPVDGAVLRVEGELAGHVTSAAWSPPLERSIALAWLRARDGVFADQVECDGRIARRVLTPFYDPEGTRGRA